MGQRRSVTMLHPARQHARSTATSPCKKAASASATTSTPHIRNGTQKCLTSSARSTKAGEMRFTLRNQNINTPDATWTSLTGPFSTGRRALDTPCSPAMQHAHNTDTLPCKLAASASATTPCVCQHTHRCLMANVGGICMVVVGETQFTRPEESSVHHHCHLRHPLHLHSPLHHPLHLHHPQHHPLHLHRPLHLHHPLHHPLHLHLPRRLLHEQRPEERRRSHNPLVNVVCLGGCRNRSFVQMGPLLFTTDRLFAVLLL